MRAWLPRSARYGALALVLVLCLFPFLWMLVISLKRQVEVFAGPSLITPHPAGQNYASLFSQYHMGALLVNSVGVVSASGGAGLPIRPPAAHRLGPFPLPWG